MRTPPTDAAGLDRVSLTEEAYRVLKREILDNRLPPGFQALEPELAARLGMSRTPVREAVIRLQKEGLIEFVPRRGVRVLPVPPSDMREIYQLLIALESLACGLLAACTPSREELQPLSREVEEMEAALAVEDRESWALADDRFHRALVGLCPNRRLANFINLLFDQAHRTRMFTLYLRALPITSTADHRRLIEMLAAGDAEGASLHNRRHRQRAAAELIGILERHNLHHL